MGVGLLTPIRQRRKPEESVLYRVLAGHLDTFLDRIEHDDTRAGLPFFVRRELRAFLDVASSREVSSACTARRAARTIWLPSRAPTWLSIPRRLWYHGPRAGPAASQRRRTTFLLGTVYRRVKTDEQNNKKRLHRWNSNGGWSFHGSIWMY